MNRFRPTRFMRVALAIAAVGLIAVAVESQWREISESARRLAPGPTALALLAVLAGLWCSGLSWRALLKDLGSPVGVRTASHMFFVGQIGKYLPGSVWPILAQMDLARTYQVPARRVGMTGIVIFGINVTTALFVAGVTLPVLAGDAAAEYRAFLALIPIGLIGLSPPVLTRALDVGMRLLRRPPLDRPLSYRGVGAAAGWAVAMWVCYGMHIWALTADLGATAEHSRLLPLATGAFALAWAVGFVIAVAPAGLGPREAALVLALSGVLPIAAATLVALVSRLLMTIGDVVMAGAGLIVRESLPKRVNQP